MPSPFYSTHKKMLRLNERLDALSPRERASFEQLFDIVWIYHDNALEGEVFTPEELRTALAERVVTVTDSSATAILRNIQAHKSAIDYVRERIGDDEPMELIALVKKLHERLTLDPDDCPGKYRREAQIHRTYFHDIAEPSRISYLLRKTLAWAESEDAEQEHPIQVASDTHLEFIRTFPFEQNAGRVGRLLLNYMLMKVGYPPLVIHAKDRQSYYDAFRRDDGSLTRLIVNSLEEAIDATNRKLDERYGEAAYGAALR